MPRAARFNDIRTRTESSQIDWALDSITGESVNMLRNRSMPACTVIPVLAYPDLDKAIDWLCNCLGFTLRLRIGDHRAQLNVGDSAIAVRHIKVIAVHSGCSVMVRVKDVNRHYEHARERGAKVLSVPDDYYLWRAPIQSGRCSGTPLDIFTIVCGCRSARVGRHSQGT